MWPGPLGRISRIGPESGGLGDPIRRFDRLQSHNFEAVGILQYEHDLNVSELPAGDKLKQFLCLLKVERGFGIRGPDRAAAEVEALSGIPKQYFHRRVNFVAGSLARLAMPGPTWSPLKIAFRTIPAPWLRRQTVRIRPQGKPREAHKRDPVQFTVPISGSNNYKKS